MRWGWGREQVDGSTMEWERQWVSRWVIRTSGVYLRSGSLEKMSVDSPVLGCCLFHVSGVEWSGFLRLALNRSSCHSCLNYWCLGLHNGYRWRFLHFRSRIWKRDSDLGIKNGRTLEHIPYEQCCYRASHYTRPSDQGQPRPLLRLESGRRILFAQCLLGRLAHWNNLAFLWWKSLEMRLSIEGRKYR